MSSHSRPTLRSSRPRGGELSPRTCSEQLLYEVEDPARYITPDLVCDFSGVSFRSLGPDAVAVLGSRPSAERPSSLLRVKLRRPPTWRVVGELSFGGRGCRCRAALVVEVVAARTLSDNPLLSRPTLEEALCWSLVGVNSLYGDPRNQVPCSAAKSNGTIEECRLRCDGRFETREIAEAVASELRALYTNGCAGVCGISVLVQEQAELCKELVDRNSVRWSISVERFTDGRASCARTSNEAGHNHEREGVVVEPRQVSSAPSPHSKSVTSIRRRLQLYDVCHSRCGDKGDSVMLSLIPHCPDDLAWLGKSVTPAWVHDVFSRLVPSQRESQLSVSVHVAPGIGALNIVVRGVLDGGVVSGRRLDRHGKSLSDYLLSQFIWTNP